MTIRTWHVSDLAVSDKKSLQAKLQALTDDGWTIDSYQTAGDDWIIVSYKDRAEIERT
jgi:hypothetical protein